MVRGSPCMCIRQTRHPTRRPLPAPPAPQRAMSLMMEAPAATAGASPRASRYRPRAARRQPAAPRSPAGRGAVPLNRNRIARPAARTRRRCRGCRRPPRPLARMRDGLRRIEKAAAVGERVRRDVDDAHDERALEGAGEAAANECGGMKQGRIGCPIRPALAVRSRRLTPARLRWAPRPASCRPACWPAAWRASARAAACRP
jgi:hypothetical protein